MGDGEEVWSCLCEVAEWSREKANSLPFQWQRSQRPLHLYCYPAWLCMGVSRMFASKCCCVSYSLRSLTRTNRPDILLTLLITPHLSHGRANKMASRPCSPTSSHT